MMTRVIAVLALFAAAVVAPGSAHAEGVKVGVGRPAPPRPVPTRAAVTPGHHIAHPQPQVIIVSSPVYVVTNRCAYSGYWTYQWVPQSAAYTVLVPGQWSPEGFWLEAHYAAQIVDSGYYQPYWVEGGYAAC